MAPSQFCLVRGKLPARFQPMKKAGLHVCPRQLQPLFATLQNRRVNRLREHGVPSTNADVLVRIAERFNLILTGPVTPKRHC